MTCNGKTVDGGRWTNYSTCAAAVGRAVAAAPAPPCSRRAGLLPALRESLRPAWPPGGAGEKDVAKNTPSFSRQHSYFVCRIRSLLTFPGQSIHHA